MQKPLALLFALLGISALSGISISISYRSSLGIFLSLLAFVVIMAIGFIIKAKRR